MMTVGIKAVHVQEHSVLEQFLYHTVTHCGGDDAYLLLLLWSVLSLSFAEAPLEGRAV